MILELTKVFEGEGYIKTYILTLDVNFFMLNPLLPIALYIIVRYSTVFNANTVWPSGLL